MAIMRTRGGDPKTCAGTQVIAAPASQYLEERMSRLYGGDYKNGWAKPAEINRIVKQIGPMDPEYFEVFRTDICDVNGRFEFKGLADGTWYVFATVTWELSSAFFLANEEGGHFVKQVKLADGSRVEVNFKR